MDMQPNSDSSLMFWSLNNIINLSVIPIMEILVAQILQSKVLFLNRIVVPLQAYVVSIQLIPTHLLMA